MMLACLVALTLPAALRAQASQATASESEQLRAWLARIHKAAERSNYAGTLVNSAGGTVVSSRVVHYVDGHSQLERIDTLDGERRTIVRVNDTVRTLWPQLRTMVVEPVDPRASFPSLVSGNEQHIPDFYEFLVQPGERIAGHDADRLLLKARVADRYDHVIWSDHATGLLLRVDVQAEGRTLESSAFSDVAIGVQPQTEAIYAELHRSEGYRVLRPLIQHTQLEAEGWAMRDSGLPRGFHPLGGLRRALPLPGSEALKANVLQAIFSDGLTHVSLFIEPFQPQRHKVSGLSVTGATHTLAHRMNDYWLTAVGDVPPGTLEQFIRALERKP